MKWLGVAVILLYVLCVSVDTKEVYISKSGIDSVSCGSQLVPCATLMYVFDEDNKYDLNDSIVHVQEGQYEVSDIFMQFNNLSLIANGTVYLKIHKYAFQIYSNNFTLDGFHFSYSTTSYISYFLLNLESYAKMHTNSNFVIKNCVFENINYYGLISADFFSENNGTLKFLNNRIYNTRSDFVMEVSNMNVVIDNLHLENYTTEGIAFKVEQQYQSLQVSNIDVLRADSYDLFYIDYALPGAISFTNVSVKHSTQRNNLFYLYSRGSINNVSVDNLYINDTSNVYFITETHRVQNCSLKNIKIEHSTNPTSNVRLDAVFEFPAGNYSANNITFSRNSAVFSILDFRSDELFSEYTLSNFSIIDNSFDNNIYYYNVEQPTGGIVHLSLADTAHISNLTAINNTGIIQIIGVSEANNLTVTNCHFENNKLTNGLAHDIVIMGNPTTHSIGEARVYDNYFADPYPNIACYDSEHGDFNLYLQQNRFGYANNSTDIYSSSLNTNVQGMCKVNCDTDELLCGGHGGSTFWLWILVALICVIVIFAIGLFVAWKLREQKRHEYEPLE